MKLETYITILDSIKDPIVFTDTNHIIRYMNTAGVKQYEKRGGASLVGTSLFACHNENSVRIIKEIFEDLNKNGDLEEVCYGVFNNKKVYMRAVRDENHKLIGYYERFGENN